MDIQNIFNSRFGVGLGLRIGRTIPPKIGYRLSGWAAVFLSRRPTSHIVKSIRQNQWVIRGGNLSSKALDIAVREVFTHAGRCFIDLYHNMRNPDGFKTLVQISPQVENLIQVSRDRTMGAFIVAPHLSNFDLCLLACGYRGLKGQVLSYAQPTGGYEIQNDIRIKTGLEITPINPEAQQRAIENMQNGGFVITGVDRPIRSKTQYLDFFGRPSPMPAGHIRMAIEARVPIIVASAYMDQDGLYHFHVSDPIPMLSHPELDQAIKINGEAVLHVIEGRIRENPGQWLMYYPVWPDVVIDGLW